MKKGSIYSLIAVVIGLLSACAASMQTYDLNQDYATSMHYQVIDDGGGSGRVAEEEEGEKSDLVGVPALSFYGGDLKRGGIWYAGRDIFLEKGDVFIFDATNVGPDSIPFGATFPPIDLLKNAVQLKISARAVSGDSVNKTEPVLYFQADDADGYRANANWPSNKIENSEEFKDYYFDLKNIYSQVYPTKHKVNGAMINNIKFFINPGKAPYTGQIYIKEIKIIPAGGEEKK